MADTGAVLVIDDDREIAGTLREFIEFRGYPVVVAHTGRNGLAFLRHTSISLVLLDLALPDMDGIAVLREAEALPEAPEIIIITGNATLDSEAWWSASWHSGAPSGRTSGCSASSPTG